MNTELKNVTYKHLAKGQEIKGWSIGNSKTFASAVVVEANSAYVSILLWGSDPDRISSEDALFIVDMSEEEFKTKYKTEAINIIKALNNKLADYEIGYHEMYNGWIQYDPFEMARNCLKDRITVLGICDSVWQTGRNSKDIGICVMQDGEKFWCHADEHYILRMIDKYKYLIG